MLSTETQRLLIDIVSIIIFIPIEIVFLIACHYHFNALIFFVEVIAAHIRCEVDIIRIRSSVLP